MNRTKAVSILFAILFAVSFTACAGKAPDTQSSGPDKMELSQSWADDSEYYFKDNVLKTKNSKLVITDVKIIGPEEEIESFDHGTSYKGKKLIAFYYDFTNISEKESEAFTIWQDCVIAHQGTMPAAPLVISSWSDDNLPDIYTPIKSGATEKYAIAYILIDDKSPVTLYGTKEMSYIEGGFTRDEIAIGEQVYPVT